MNAYDPKYRRFFYRPSLHITFAMAIAGTIMSASSAALAASGKFGMPPSGSVPILFNDRHVYDRPTKLVHARVLSAIAVGRGLLVPARSLFEAMGAKFTYDAATGVIRASKADSDIRLTVGKPEVVINGETRSLDVPPRVEGGTTYVPIRVLAEGLGAYVSWVRDEKLVSIHYGERVAVAAPKVTESAEPAVATITTPAPKIPIATPSPTSVGPVKAAYVRFLAADLNLKPAVSNEFNAGKNGSTTQRIRGVLEYRLGARGGRNFFEVEYRRWSYPHAATAVGVTNGTLCSAPGGPIPNVGDPGCVTTIGGRTSAFVNPTRLSNSELEIRNGLIGFGGHTYIASASRTEFNDYGYPRLKADFGVGLERLPDVNRPFSVFASVYYFPELGGKYGLPNGSDLRLRYKLISYEGGLDVTIPKSPFFFEVGAMSERYIVKENAPSDISRKALNLGFGLHF